MEFLEEDCHSCRFWSQMLSLLKQAILITDEQGAILFANDAAGAMMRLSVPEMRGTGFSRFVTPEDHDHFYSNLLYLARNGRSFEGEIMLLRGDSCRFIANLSMHPRVHPRSGDPVLFLCIQDIQEKKEIERTMAREYFPDLVKIADGIAHEIRNPLVGIGGFAQRLHKLCANQPENQQYFELLMQNVRKIENLVKKVNFLAKLPKPVMSKASVKEAIEESVAEFRPRIDAMKTSLALELKNIRLCMDPELIGRAVSILIENALDAVPEGGKMTIRAEHNGGEACIRVSDNGKGIDPADLPFVFNPFFSTKPDGAGIDLAIAKRIAESHGGTVEVSSTPGGGATFSLRLPLEKRRAVRARPLDRAAALTHEGFLE